MSDKIYLVKAIEVGVSADDAFEYVVGYATSLEEAEAACKKLKAENEEDHAFWEKYGQHCYIECDAWPTADDPEAIATLEKERKCNKCPYAELELKEVFYGKDNKSGGIELRCKNKCSKCYCPTEYNYVIEEVERL